MARPGGLDLIGAMRICLAAIEAHNAKMDYSKAWFDKNQLLRTDLADVCLAFLTHHSPSRPAEPTVANAP